MTEETRLARLKSKNRYTLLDALIDIFTDTTSGPSEEERSRLLELLRHRDSDIRAETVNVAGSHWQLEEAYPILLRMISGEETDQVVLTEACTALGALVASGRGDLGEVSKRLAVIVLNEDLDDGLRNTAYLSLCHIHGQVATAEPINGARGDEQLDIDADWVKSLRA